MVDGRLDDPAALRFRPGRRWKRVRALGEICNDRHAVVDLAILPAQPPLADRLAARCQEGRDAK